VTDTRNSTHNKGLSVALSTTTCDVKEFYVPFVWLSAETAVSSLCSILSVRDTVLETAIVQTTSDRLSVRRSACLCVILAKHDMVLYKKNRLATVSFMKVGSVTTRLHGRASVNLTSTFHTSRPILVKFLIECLRLSASVV
jgi:hypothetical protein